MWQGERIPLPFSLIHSIDLTNHTQMEANETNNPRGLN